MAATAVPPDVMEACAHYTDTHLRSAPYVRVVNVVSMYHYSPEPVKVDWLLGAWRQASLRGVRLASVVRGCAKCRGFGGGTPPIDTLPGVMWNPRKFKAPTFRICNSCTLAFETHAVCPGLPSVEAARIAAQRFVRLMHRAGVYGAEVRRFTVTNMVCCAATAFEVDIDAIASAYPMESEYKSGKFPGLNFYLGLRCLAAARSAALPAAARSAALGCVFLSAL